MKVRKPTSKRKSTRLQKGIQKKISAHNRKQKKLSKKDPTWKSRHPKDPGIPNSFPYKGQLLEEIEVKKQAAIEAREARREKQRQDAIARGASADDLLRLEKEQDLVDNHDRLGALMSSVQQANVEFDGGHDQNELEDEEMGDSEDGSDVEEGSAELDTIFEEMRQDSSRKAFDKNFKQVLDTCDIVIYVLDARNPLGTRSKQVEETVLQHPGKRLVFALNKIDLIPTEVLQTWVKYLSKSFPTVPINASGAAPNAHTFEHPNKLSRASTATGLLTALKKWAGQANLGRQVTIGVIGFPNVGKSSIINALLGTHGGGRSCPVGAQAGVTTDVRRVKVDGKLAILDSPGIAFPNSATKAKSPVDEQARLILLNAMPPRYVDDCRPAASKLVKRLQRQPEQFELFAKHYDLPPIPMVNFEDFMTQVLVHVGRKMGRMNRGGTADLRGASLAIVNDWTSGRISGWAVPPAEPVEPKNVRVVSSWSKEFDLDSILAGVL